MLVSRGTLVFFAAGVLLTAAGIQALFADKQMIRPSIISTMDPSDRSLLRIITPALTDPVEHRAEKTCGAGQLYSSHDVVGAPEPCFMGRLDVHNGTSSGSHRRILIRKK